MEIKNINISKLVLNKGQIKGLPTNPRFIRDFKFELLKRSIKESPDMLKLRELIVFPEDDKYIIIAGNMRYRAAKELNIKELPCKILSRETSIEKLREIAIKDNSNFGEYDWDILANEWDDSPLEDWGVDLPTDWQESDNVNIDDLFTDADGEKKEKFVLKIEFQNEEQKTDFHTAIKDIIKQYNGKIN